MSFDSQATSKTYGKYKQKKVIPAAAAAMLALEKKTESKKAKLIVEMAKQVMNANTRVAFENTRTFPTLKRDNIHVFQIQIH